MITSVDAGIIRAALILMVHGLLFVELAAVALVLLGCAETLRYRIWLCMHLMVRVLIEIRGVYIGVGIQWNIQYPDYVVRL